MRKTVALTALVGLLAFSGMAQVKEYYVEAGFGAGVGFTSLDGTDFSKLITGSVSDFAIEFAIKGGMGLFDGLPLYATIEYGGIGHMFFDNRDYIQFNSYLLGPGLMYYPIPQLQLAASVGYSFTANSANDGIVDNSSSGIAWNLSAGYEIGEGRRRALVGLKYINTYNELDKTKVTMNSSAVCVFVRYVWRNR